jgi:nicotinamide phosphoribosyltransferase
MEYYSADGPVGYSVPASEHSTITSWGRDNEKAAYENMVDLFSKPGSIVSCVSDSYDIYNACENLWPSLRYKIVESGSTLVIRPDSGNPMEVLPVITRMLAKKFGYTTNSKKFMVLKNVRILWGDGINIKTIDAILDLMVGLGFSAENFVFGMGGALLQKVNRDTLKFAMKTSSVTLKDDTKRDVYKEPINEPFKKSKAGIQDTRITKTGEIVSGPIDSLSEDAVTIFHGVFQAGVILRQYTFDDVRKNAEIK